MNLGDIYRHAVQRPDALAAVNSGVPFTYRRFAGMIELTRRGLSEQALPEGGIVAVMGGSLLYNWVLQIAVRSLGYTAITAGSWDVIDGLRLENLSGIAAFDKVYAGWDDDPAARRGCLGLRVPLDPLADADSTPLPDGLDEPLGGDLVVFTSATTGEYKKVGYYSDVWAERCGYYREIGLGFREDDVVHVTSFGAWTGAGALMPQRAWTVGATVVFDQREEWLDHLFDYPVTSIFLTDATMKSICDSTVRQPGHYPLLDMQMGGGFISGPLLHDLRQRFNCQPAIMYGGTEFVPALYNKVGDVDDLLWLTPTRGDMLEIVDEDDRPVPDNVAGIVRVRLHAWESASYYDEPETTEMFYRDGCFYPGDMAMRRGDGRVRILGRTKDVLVVGGVKVPVDPHERRAQEILGVDKVCLFSRQAENGDTVLLVAIEGENLPARERLQAMAAYYAKTFTEAKFACLSSFPRGTNGLGKIDRRAILELAEG